MSNKVAAEEQIIKFCDWCNRKINEEHESINLGNEEIGTQSYHEKCYERALDKLGL